MKSHLINSNFALEYGEFHALPHDFVVGYKLVRKIGENYYSVASGHQRYKIGNVDATTTYSKIYRKIKLFKAEMVGKTAVFADVDSIYDVYEDFISSELHTILKIKLTNSLVSSVVKGHLIYAGETITTIEEYGITKN